MQCCVDVIDYVASQRRILNVTTEIACLVDNGAKLMHNGLSQHPQLTVSMTRTHHFMLDSRYFTTPIQSLVIIQNLAATTEALNTKILTDKLDNLCSFVNFLAARVNAA